MSGFTSLFFHSSYLIWTALIASPIIIHLINRLRYKRVRFAAMEFLLISQQKNRRRVLLEQLLLLLLRILIVLLIVFLIARMMLDSSGSVFRGAKTHHVVVLDDSVSMTEKWKDAGAEDPTTAFEQAKEAIVRLANEGAKQPGQQTLTLIRLSEPDKQILEKEPINEESVDLIKAELGKIKPTNRALKMDEGLKGVGRYLKASGDTGVRILHIVSDFREEDWGARAVLAEETQKIAGKQLPVNLVRAVPVKDNEDRPIAHNNLVVTEFEGNLAVADVKTPLELRVTVANYGDSIARDVRMRVFVNGNSESVMQTNTKQVVDELRFPDIPVNETKQVKFTLSIKEAGWAQIKVRLADASLSDDRLPTDDERYLAVNVKASKAILAIDGDNDIDEGGDKWLPFAFLDKRGGGASEAVVTVKQGTLNDLRDTNLAQYSCIYLMDVPKLDEVHIDLLKRFVENGGGLVWFAGKAMTSEIDYYNQTLYEQHKLFPVPLARQTKTFTPAPKDEVEEIKFKVSDAGADLATETTHTIFSQLYYDDGSMLDVVRVYEYLPVARTWTDSSGSAINWDVDDSVRKDGVATICRLRGGEPFVFESRLGKGRIVAHLTTAGPAWTNWPLEKSSFPTYHGMLFTYVARDPGKAERPIGEPFVERFPRTEFESKVEVRAPGVEKKDIIASEVLQQPKENPKKGDDPKEDPKDTEDKEKLKQLEVTVPDTGHSGILQVILTRKAEAMGPDKKKEKTEVRMFAYNVPTTQSNLKPITDDALQEKVGKEGKIHVRSYGSEDWLSSFNADRSIRNWLLFLLVVFMVLEMLLAYRLSYHTSNRRAR